MQKVRFFTFAKYNEYKIHPLHTSILMVTLNKLIVIIMTTNSFLFYWKGSAEIQRSTGALHSPKNGDGDAWSHWPPFFNLLSHNDPLFLLSHYPGTQLTPLFLMIHDQRLQSLTAPTFSTTFYQLFKLFRVFFKRCVQICFLSGKLAKIVKFSLFDPFFGLLTECPPFWSKISHQKTHSFPRGATCISRWISSA